MVLWTRPRSTFTSTPVGHTRAYRGCSGGGGLAERVEKFGEVVRRKKHESARRPQALLRTALAPNSRCANVLGSWMVRRMQPRRIGCRGCRWTERCIPRFLSCTACRHRALWGDGSLVGGGKIDAFLL